MCLKFYRFSAFSLTFSRVTVSFNTENLLPAKRIDYYNLADFLANSGGLFNLCMGASVLSFVELIYYFTIRPLCTRRSTQR